METGITVLEKNTLALDGVIKQQANLLEQSVLQQQINQAVLSSIEFAKKEIKEYVDEQINIIKNICPLSDGEATKLKSVIQKRALITTKIWIKREFGDSNYGGREFFSKKYGHIIRAFYTLLKKEFNAIKYTAIKHVDIEDALHFASQLNFTSLNSQTKRITESQLKTLNEWEKRNGKALTLPKD